jgi:ubiquinone/menaquinone biosynthesis C-methylase UbiE
VFVGDIGRRPDLGGLAENERIMKLGSAGVVDPQGQETRALHRLVDFAGKHVLEIGSGDGRLTWRYADHAASVLGLDPDETQIVRAREAMPSSLRSRVTFQAADAARVDLPQGAFNVVVLAWSI